MGHNCTREQGYLSTADEAGFVAYTKYRCSLAEMTSRQECELEQASFIGLARMLAHKKELKIVEIGRTSPQGNIFDDPERIANSSFSYC